MGWVTVRGYTCTSWYLTKAIQAYSSRPSGHPCLGRHNEYWRWFWPPLGKKRRVLRYSGHVPGLLAYWPSRVKALVAMGLKWVNPRRLKSLRKWMSSRATDLQVHALSSSVGLFSCCGRMCWVMSIEQSFCTHPRVIHGSRSRSRTTVHSCWSRQSAELRNVFNLFQISYNSFATRRPTPLSERYVYLISFSEKRQFKKRHKTSTFW